MSMFRNVRRKHDGSLGKGVYLSRKSLTSFYGFFVTKFNKPDELAWRLQVGANKYLLKLENDFHLLQPEQFKKEWEFVQ